MGKKKKESKRKEQVLKEDSGVEGSISDRFDTSKPQFRKPKQQSSKVVLDERFASVLTDPRFQLDVKDKYGRRKRKEEATEELSAFYTVEGEGQKSHSDENDGDSFLSSDETEKPEKERAENEKEDAEDDDEDPNSRIAYLTALSRGELDVSSSSDEDDDDDDDESQSDDDSSVEGEDPVHGTTGVLDPSYREKDIELTNEESPYLAVMNMDWSHVSAVDIFAIISSFTPPGAVKRVRVFPSDFGLERLAKEEIMGPKGLWQKKTSRTTDSKEIDGDAMEESSLDEHSDDESSDGEDSSKEEGDEDGLSEDMQGENDFLPRNEHVESDFDPEKLRAYEASKLRYYFAVVEFASSQYADIAYKQVDGLEFEHSSAAMDLRSIAVEELDSVIKDRPLRDEAANIPGNYAAPDFVNSALQQTSVQCTWEMGDHDRERSLTKYASGQAWEAMAEQDDLKAYLASDISSDEDEEDGENSKVSRMRRMLGLDSDDDEDGGGGTKIGSLPIDSSESGSEEESEDVGKEVMFVPGQNALAAKIRSKIESKDEPKELTPWQKYQEKRKQKRRERKQAARAKRKEVNEVRRNESGAERLVEAAEQDSFFVDDVHDRIDSVADIRPGKQAEEELALLVAGDDGEEEARDFDMRGLQRIEKNKDKKLRGSRKRKEAELAASVSGTEFKVNVKDDRFKAVLDGVDKFGIDRTDPSYKDTPAMRDIFAEQTRRRKSKKGKKRKTDGNKTVVPDVSAESEKPTSGSAALSALVKSIKSRVNQ